jgi:hypothetical protein
VVFMCAMIRLSVDVGLHIDLLQVTRESVAKR